VGGLALVSWLQQKGQQARFDRLLLRLPGLGQVARKFATSQMSRTLATLLGGGLPLVNALDIAARSIGNQFMAGQLDIVGSRVREGQSFAAALDARGVFPEVAVKMAEVGESTGALQDMLNTVADFYDEEIATSMERFVTLVEPALLVIMGIVIAGLLLALYMPLFQLSSVLGQ
jgi:type IV pilus assembly protein PilC